MTDKTDAERRAEMHDAQEMLKDLVIAAMSEDPNKGIVAIRVFYAVAHGDGTFSAGNLGGVGEGNEDAAEKLMRNILALIVNAYDEGELTIRRKPEKH